MCDALRLPLLVLLPLSTACTPSPLSPGSTGDVFAYLIVGAGGSGKAEARAEPRVGGASNAPLLQLTNGDDFSIADGARRSPLGLHVEPTGEVWYEAGLLADTPGTEYVISLARAGGDPGAPRSVVTMPAPPSLTSPPPGATLSRATDDITLEWGPAGSAEQLLWKAHGDCLGENGGLITGDPGMFVIRAGTLIPAPGRATDTCDIRVEVMRDRAGQLDAGFAGGFIVARQVRGAYVSSRP